MCLNFSSGNQALRAKKQVHPNGLPQVPMFARMKGKPWALARIILANNSTTAEQSVKNCGAHSFCNVNKIAHTSARYELWSAPRTNCASITVYPCSETRMEAPAEMVNCGVS